MTIREQQRVAEKKARARAGRAARVSKAEANLLQTGVYQGKCGNRN